MTRSEAKDAIESHMKEIHQEKITLYVDMKDQVQRSKILEHSLRQTRQWKKLMHLGEVEVFFTKYSDVKEKKHKLPVYRKYDKSESLRRM